MYIRNQSVWDIPLFNAFENLGIQRKFKNRATFIDAFNETSKKFTIV